MDGVTFAVALRSRTLWCLAIGSACLWFAIQAMTSQITIYFEQEAGLAPQRATALYSTILACSVAGKFLFGAVSDRFREAAGHGRDQPDAAGRLPAAVHRRRRRAGAGRQSRCS